MKMEKLIFSTLIITTTLSCLANDRSIYDENPDYTAKLVNVDKKLFYQIKLNMSYKDVLNIIKKQPLYCLDTESNNKIDPTKALNFSCRWDGAPSKANCIPGINVFFKNRSVNDFNLTTQDGTFYGFAADINNGKILIMPCEN